MHPIQTDPTVIRSFGSNLPHEESLQPASPPPGNQRPPAELGVWGWPLEGARATSAGSGWFLKIFSIVILITSWYSLPGWNFGRLGKKSFVLPFVPSSMIAQLSLSMSIFLLCEALVESLGTVYLAVTHVLFMSFIFVISYSTLSCSLAASFRSASSKCKWNPKRLSRISAKVKRSRY